MKIGGESLIGRISFIFLAVLINGLMLVMIPYLSTGNHHRGKNTFFDPVFLANYQPPPPPPPERHKARPKPKEEKPKKIPKVSVKQKKIRTHRPRIMKLEVPVVKFEINPLLKTGMAVAPPPPEPPKPEPVVQTAPPAPVEAPPAPVKKAVPQAIPSEFGIDEVDQKPKILRKVNPLYPYRAKRRNINGKVLIKFLVSSSGHVHRASIVESNPKGVFEQSALQAIRKWRFKPGYYQGKAVPTWVILPIHFQLNG